MSSSSSTSRIQDREDRLLAYYINLINQQEKQQEKQPVESVEKKKGVKSVEETVEKERPTPRKPSKSLAREEAERIIATILDKRPGRAQFTPPVVPAVIPSLVPPEVPPVVPPVGAKKRGRPRKIVPQVVVVEDNTKAIPEEPPAETNIVLTDERKEPEPIAEIEEVVIPPPPSPTEKKAEKTAPKKKKARNISVETKLGETITSAPSNRYVSEYSNSTFEAEARISRWWRKPISLELLDFEDEIELSIAQLRCAFSLELQDILVSEQDDKQSLASRMLIVFPFS